VQRFFGEKSHFIPELILTGPIALPESMCTDRSPRKRNCELFSPKMGNMRIYENLWEKISAKFWDH